MSSVPHIAASLAPPEEPLFSAELALRQDLHELGFTRHSIALLKLWPQIVLGWSNGPITEDAQHRLLDRAESVIFDQTGWDLLRNWLSYRPPARARESGLRAVTILQNMGYLPPDAGRATAEHFRAKWTTTLPLDAVGTGRLTVDRSTTAYGLHHGDVEAGRGTDCPIRLTSDNTVSRHHCVFHRTQKGWVVEDRSSVSGTRVNGQRVLRRLLIGGETLRIGMHKIHFMLEDDGVDELPTDQGR